MGVEEVTSVSRSMSAASGAPLASREVDPGCCNAEARALRPDVQGQVLAEVIELRPRSREVRTVYTTRGRLVLTLGVVFLATLALLVRMGVADASTGGDAARIATVTSETSLSEVARKELPDLPVREATIVLRGFNDLGGLSLERGQRVAIPRL